MLTGLGHKVAKLVADLVADLIPVGHSAVLDHITDQGVEVLAVTLEGQVESHVIDAGAQVVDLVQGNADVVGQVPGREEHAVAQAHGIDARRLVERPAEHGHGVHIVQEQRVGAQLLHVLAHVQQHRNGAQSAHDAAHAQRVADGLAQAVLFGDLKVNDRAGLVTAHLEHGDGIVGAVQGRPAVGGDLKLGLGLQLFGQLVAHDL